MSKRQNMLEKYQSEIGEWAYDNFGRPKLISRAEHDFIHTNDPLLGMMEELGELCRSVLKSKQKIRIGEDHLAKEKDAIGDLMIFLLDYCNRRGFSASEILKITWEEVSKRDWVNDPVEGKQQDIIDQQRAFNRTDWEHDPVPGTIMAPGQFRDGSVG